MPLVAPRLVAMKQNSKQLAKVSGNRDKNAKSKKTRSGFTDLSCRPSFKGQPCWDVWLPGLPAKGTTTVTSGLLSASYGIGDNRIQGFTARFRSTFIEYRIVQAKVFIRMFGSTNPGVVQFYFDEKSTAAAVLADAQERYTRAISASDTTQKYVFNWTAHDPLDLQYTAIASSITPVSFKYYTDNANFGSSIVATDYFEVESYFRFQFRGIQSA